MAFREFLATSFAILQHELPWAYVGLCRQLAPRTVALQVDGEAMALQFTVAGVAFDAAAAEPAITIRTGRAAILAVIDAEDSLLSAVLDDRLHLQGSPDDLLAFHDGLMLYVHGAVRAPSFPALLRRFRADAAPGVAA